jgi:HK97 family phage major capsid protein
MEKENLIFFGDAVKVIGENKVGGYLVRFSSEQDPDLVGDFFTKDTDLGIEAGSRLPVYYQHGYDTVLKSRKLGRATAEYQDVGIWLEAQLEMRDEYERGLMELAAAGKLGWSSGAAGHLVEREQVGKSWHIKSWPIAEASLTPTPAEPRNTAISVKSLFTDNEQEPEKEPDTTKEVKMTDEIKAPEVKQELPDFEALIKSAVAEAVKAAQEPQVKAGVEVVEDEADKALRENPFKPNEFFKAVAMWDRGYRDKRLFPLKASGLNEAIPSEGGFLVTPDIANGIYENMWSVGNVLSRFSPITVSGNGLTIRAVDETSRADGSRMGGVRGYWLNEAADKTASKPTFRNIDLKLKKVAALVYATDELLDDTQALEGWITRNVPDELRFQVEASIINGLGVASPLGILQSGCLISATRADANLVADEDISGMWSRRYLGPQDYVWFVNATVMPQLYAMSVGNSPVYVPPGGFSASPYGSLFGRPVIETEYNPYLGTVGDILLASPSQYALITKGGVQSASSIHVKFVEDETAFRFVFRVDGEPIWASAVTAYDGTNTVSPFVALAATT